MGVAQAANARASGGAGSSRSSSVGWARKGASASAFGARCRRLSTMGAAFEGAMRISVARISAKRHSEGMTFTERI